MTKNNELSIKTGPEVYSIKLDFHFTNENVRAMREALRGVSPRAYSEWHRGLMAEAREFVTDFMRYKREGLGRSIDRWEIRFKTAEGCSEAFEALRPDLKKFLRASTSTPVSFGGIF